MDKEKFQESTNNIVVKTLSNLAEGLTGIAASKKQNIALSIGHIFQTFRGGQFLSQFQKEWNAFREKGRIKEDYEYTEQNYECLHELLDFLEKEIPDERRFSIIKKVFLVTATESMSDRNSLLPQQYMKICKKLESGEIMVLNATYSVAKEDWWQQERHFGAARWLEIITDKSGLGYKELVEIYEQGLIDKNHISERELADRSGISIKPYFRLTSLGYNLCEYIQSYEIVA